MNPIVAGSIVLDAPATTERLSATPATGLALAPVLDQFDLVLWNTSSKRSRSHIIEDFVAFGVHPRDRSRPGLPLPIKPDTLSDLVFGLSDGDRGLVHCLERTLKLHQARTV